MRRAESQILDDIRDVDCQLSPENLSCDGELSARQVRVKYRKLMAQRNQLVKELGRKPTTKELFDI